VLHALDDRVGGRVDHEDRARLGAHDVAVELPGSSEGRLARRGPEPLRARARCSRQQ